MFFYADIPMIPVEESSGAIVVAAAQAATARRALDRSTWPSVPAGPAYGTAAAST